MTAGSGIEHSEFNASKSEPVHLLQIWLRPSRRGLEPGYAQKHFPLDARRGRLALLVSPDGADGSLTMNQDARLYAAILSPGQRVEHTVAPGRHAWIQVARGSVTLNEHRLTAGDGAAVSDETRLAIESREESELLVFDLA
jgi:redox-sensitive bicupin YhaK (pirin superfamily)